MNPRRKRPSKANFSYQTLEQRNLLAGDVSVIFNNEILTITGDSAANEIRLVGDSSGGLQVVPVTGTTVNGTSNTFSTNGSVGQILVQMGDGDDSLVVEQFAVEGFLDIGLGDGNNRLQVEDIRVRSLNIEGGTGDEVLQFHNTHVLRGAIINTLAGNDTLAITAMAVENSFIVSMGLGDDDVAIDNLGVTNVFELLTGDGNDRVFMTGEVYAHRGIFSLLGGDDSLNFVPQSSNTTALFQRGISVLAGAGNDSVFVGPSVTTRGKSFIDGGADDDNIGTSSSSLRKLGIGQFESRTITNVNEALTTFLTDLQEDDIDTAPFTNSVSQTVTLSVQDGALTVPANSAPLFIDNQLTLTTESTVTGATVRVVDSVATEDVLAFTNSGSITGSFDAATGVLTLTGNGTAAEYQAALRTITYDNTNSVSTAGTKQIRFEVNTAQGSSTDTRTLTLLGLTAPTFTTTSTALQIPFGSAAVPIDNGLTLTGASEVTVTGATVAVNSFVASQDVLAYANANGINGTFNSTTGILTLSSTTALPLSTYQTALRTVTYDTSSAAALSKRINFTVNTNAGNVTASRDLAIQAAPPAVLSTTLTNLTIPENAAAIVVDPGVTVTGTGEQVVSQATVRITTGFEAEDRLAFTNASPITGSYDTSTGVLTLSGNSSLAAYQAALRTVTFDNTRSTSISSSRRVEFSLVTGSGPSNTVGRNLTLEGLAGPTLEVSSAPLKHFGNTAAQPVDNQMVLTTPAGVTISQINVTVANGVTGQDVLAFTNTANISGAFDSNTRTMTLTGNGSATTADFQAALRTVTYDNTQTTTLESTRRINVVVTTNRGAFTKTRQVDLGDQLAIEAFAAANSLTTQRTSSGLHYIIETEGNGTRPTINDRVRVNYVGRLTNGNEFDSNDGAEFPLTGVIRGWQEGIPLFSVGGSGQLLIPSSLAYAGNPPSADIPVNAVLIFDIDLLAIV